MSAPTRFPSGVTNVAAGNPLGNYGLPDPTQWHTFFDDFDFYTAADWTVTEVGVATQVLDDADGGSLLITNAAADNNSSFSQKVGESFTFVAGKRLLFKARFSIDDVSLASAVMGLQITDTTPLAVADGVYFFIDDLELNGTADLIAISSAAGTTTEADVATLVDATAIELAFYYDGKDEIQIFVDGAKVASIANTNMPATELTVSYGVQNGSAVVRTMSVDYILVAKER